METRTTTTALETYLDEFFYGYAGNDTFHGDGGSDVLRGHGDNDNLFGGEGPDDLWGYGGNDDLAAGSGQDSAHDADSGGDVDRVCDGASADTIDVQDGDGLDKIYLTDDGVGESISKDAGDQVFHNSTCPF